MQKRLFVIGPALCICFFSSFSLAHAETEEIIFDQLITAEISVPKEVDRYTFDAEEGQKITIAAFWGSSVKESAWGGLNQFGVLQLYTQSGVLLLKLASTSRGLQWNILDDFTLPENGTYAIHISHSFSGTGSYWFGVSDPNPRSHTLSTQERTHTAFGVRGSQHIWEVNVQAGNIYAWSIQGERPFFSWIIRDPNGDIFEEREWNDHSTIAFQAEQSGLYQIALEPFYPTFFISPKQIGPFPYTLTPATTALQATVIDGDIETLYDTNLYGFFGSSGSTVTISAYWGSNAPDAGESGLHAYGQFRLLGEDGSLLAMRSPESLSRAIQSSTLNDFVIPHDGTYFVDVRHKWGTGTGTYSLGISSTLEECKPLPLTGETHGTYGVRGDRQKWIFQRTAGQELKWTYTSATFVKRWTVQNPDGTELISQDGSREFTMIITPNMSGTHTLILEDFLGNISTKQDIGPFSYVLIGAETNAPPEDALLLRYAPILHIFDDDYRPKEIAAILSESDLYKNNFIVQDQLINSNPTLSIIAHPELDTNYYLDIENAEPGNNPILPDPERFTKYQTAIYGRRTLDSASEENNTNLPLLKPNTAYTILQYWFFYPYNNFIWRHSDGTDRPGNNHEGDWEMIQLILDPETEHPLYAIYSWHWGGTVYKWEELEVTNETHPHVYVGKGGHASWGEGGVNFYVIEKQRGDITPDTSDVESIKLTSLNCDMNCENFSLLEIPENQWNNFPGIWGEPEKLFSPGSGGPFSPKFIGYGLNNPTIRWSEPIKCSNDPTPFGWSAQANSPVNLSVFDPSGNRVGANVDGTIDAEIPGLYEFVPSDDGPEYVTIFTEERLMFELQGTDVGTMDFFVSKLSEPPFDEALGMTQMNQNAMVFEDVPVSPTFIGIVSTEDDLMQIDQNGDGVLDGLHGQGDAPTLSTLIAALSDDAFHKRFRHTRHALLSQAQLIERLLQQGLHRQTVRRLTVLEKLCKMFLQDNEEVLQRIVVMQEVLEDV